MSRNDDGVDDDGVRASVVAPIREALVMALQLPSSPRPEWRRGQTFYRLQQRSAEALTPGAVDSRRGRPPTARDPERRWGQTFCRLQQPSAEALVPNGGRPPTAAGDRKGAGVRPSDVCGNRRQKL